MMIIMNNKNGIMEKQLKKPAKKGSQKKYILHLYIAGLSPRSQKAIDNTKKICEKYLKGEYELVIQDIYQNPIIAINNQILAIPTLVKELPHPLCKFVGDMSNLKKLLVGLDIHLKE
jgi:circadian clock protein KaiB